MRLGVAPVRRARLCHKPVPRSRAMNVVEVVSAGAALGSKCAPDHVLQANILSRAVDPNDF